MEIRLSIGLVLYKPNFCTLQKVMDNLFKSQGDFFIQLYCIDNSADEVWHEKLKTFVESLSPPSFIYIELLDGGGNLGYGKGNNVVLEKINSDYHLILNPDVFVYEDTLQKSIDFMEKHTEVGLLIPNVFGENGERHYLCKKNPNLWMMFVRFLPTQIRRLFQKSIDLFEMQDKNYNDFIWDIPNPTGCFMFFRTRVFKELNGFDPHFFLYYEDSDIGRRTLEISQSVYNPNVKIIHQWQRDAHKKLKARLIMIKSGLRYFMKWGGIF
jgi:GT2 family glycosyltransferase